MSGKTVESTVFPQQDLRPVGHVFVTEGSAVHRVNHGAASLLFGRRIIDPDRSAVSVAFDFRLTGFAPQGDQAMDGYWLLKERTQI
jgi:hypothetical protein